MTIDLKKMAPLEVKAKIDDATEQAILTATAKHPKQSSQILDNSSINFLLLGKIDGRIIGDHHTPCCS